MTRLKNLSSFREHKMYPALACAALIFLGVFIVSGHSNTGQYWSSWYPLYVPETQVDDSLVTRISDLSGGNFLYYHNARITYNGFNGMSTVSMAELERGERLLPSDPRLDPFMRGAGKYFKAGIYRIFYLPVSLSPLEYRYRLRAYWDSSWVFPDGNWDRTLIWLAGIFSFTALILSGGKFFALLALIAYTGLSAAAGNVNILLPGMVTLFLMNHYGKTGPFSLFLALLIPFSGIAALVSGMLSFMDCTAFLTIYFFSLTLKGRTRKIPRKRRENRKKDWIQTAGKDHDLFVPVPLSGRKGLNLSSVGNRKENPIPLILQASMLVVITLLSFMTDRVLPVSVPSRIAGSERDWSWGSFSRADLSKDLPGTVELLMHRAYQESIPYGGTWSIPGKGDSISLPVYKMDEGQIRSSLEIIRVFDEDWLNAFLQLMPLEGPGLLFSTEPGPVNVEMTSAVLGAPGLQGLTAQAMLLFIGIILSLMNLSGITVKGSEDFRMRNHFLILRRKQQAA